MTQKPKRPGGPRAEALVPGSDDERLLQRILTTTTNLIYIYDLVEHRNVYANREVTEYLGYTPQQVLDLGSELFARIMHPDDAAIVAAHHARCAKAAEGETLEVEYRMQHSNGEWRWLFSRDVPFARDASGSVTQILGVCSDFTERKRSEEALLAANALQSAIFQSMRDGFSLCGDDGVHTAVNPALIEMTGFSEEELVGTGLPHPYWPPEHYDSIAAAFARAQEGEGPEFELTFMRKNGERFPVVVSPSIVRDADGNTVSVFAMMRDVTERETAIEALRESEERYRSLVSVLREGIMLQAADGRLLTFNDAAAEIFHIGAESVLGHRSTDRDWGTIREDGTDLPAEDHPSMVTFRTGQPCTEVLVGVRGPAGVRWIEVNTEAMIRPGESLPYAVVISCTDVTERRRADAELKEYKNGLEALVRQRTAEFEEASRAKSQFLASMSHELRTPLNSIIGFTGIMLQGLTGELTSEQRAQLEMVNRAGRQLLGLVSDVLDLERIETGRVELDLEDVDVPKLATALAETIRPMSEDVGLTVDLDLERAPARVRTDRAKLEQILLNFLSNAVKYTETGSISLIVASRADGSVAFTVRDTGIGIAPEDQVSVFEEFRQLPAHRGAKHPGSGLGLSISRQLAELLGARIDLESAPGTGSAFTLVLPADRDR